MSLSRQARRQQRLEMCHLHQEPKLWFWKIQGKNLRWKEFLSISQCLAHQIDSPQKHSKRWSTAKVLGLQHPRSAFKRQDAFLGRFHHSEKCLGCLFGLIEVSASRRKLILIVVLELTVFPWLMLIILKLRSQHFKFSQRRRLNLEIFQKSKQRLQRKIIDKPKRTRD